MHPLCHCKLVGDLRNARSRLEQPRSCRSRVSRRNRRGPGQGSLLVPALCNLPSAKPKSLFNKPPRLVCCTYRGQTSRWCLSTPRRGLEAEPSARSQCQCSRATRFSLRFLSCCSDQGQGRKENPKRDWLERQDEWRRNSRLRDHSPFFPATPCTAGLGSQ